MGTPAVEASVNLAWNWSRQGYRSGRSPPEEALTARGGLTGLESPSPSLSIFVPGIRKCGQNYSPQAGPCQLKCACIKNECMSGHLGSADFFASNLTAVFTFLLAVISIQYK